MVHSVIDASPEFKGKSKGGLYGDTIEELDFHVGRLLDTIDKLGLRENTLVIFTTDNGPWSNAKESLGKKHNGQIAWGSSGPLRAAKGSTYEGGLRVPCIARWPDHVPADATSDAIFATIDFLPTFAALTGFEVPADRLIDGVNQTELLLGKSKRGARNDYAYFCQGELHGVRRGQWKLFKANRKKFYGYVDDKGSADIELYNLNRDIGEKSNIAADHADVVKELLEVVEAFPMPKTAYNPGIRSPRGDSSRCDWFRETIAATLLRALQNATGRTRTPQSTLDCSRRSEKRNRCELLADDHGGIDLHPVSRNTGIDRPEVGGGLQVAFVEIGQAWVIADDASGHRCA